MYPKSLITLLPPSFFISFLPFLINFAFSSSCFFFSLEKSYAISLEWQSLQNSIHLNGIDHKTGARDVSQASPTVLWCNYSKIGQERIKMQKAQGAEQTTVCCGRSVLDKQVPPGAPWDCYIVR